MDKEKLESEIRAFNAAIVPFESMDIEIAIEVAEAGGHNGDWVAEEVKNYTEDVGTPLDQVDLVYVVYDALLQEARNDISETTGVDILNDLDPSMEVYKDYSSSCIDFTDEARTKLLEIISRIPEEGRTVAIKW